MWRDKNDRVHLLVDEARGGEEIMRSNLRRFIFLAGLTGSVALVIILLLAGLA